MAPDTHVNASPSVTLTKVTMISPTATTTIANNTTTANNTATTTTTTTTTATAETEKRGCCGRFTDSVNNALENAFYKLGVAVAKRPWETIAVCLLVSGLAMIGFIASFEESRGEKLWVDQTSKTVTHSEWVSKTFPSKSRVANVIAESPSGANILTAAGLQALVQIDEKVKNIRLNKSNEWSKICFSQTAVAGDCSPSTVLEIWGNDYSVIKKLSGAQILTKINQKPLISPLTRRPLDVKILLGGISEDGSGKIDGAKATVMTYLLKNQAAEGEQLDVLGKDWELAFGEAIGSNSSGMKTYVWSRSTFSLDSGNSIQGDVKLLSIGYVLIVVYLALMLGTFTKIDHKIWMALCGVLCIGLSIGISYGLCGAFGQPITPLHNILAFLVLGIGVDDVFVIVQTFYNTHTNEDNLTEKIGQTVKHAGVSILITSLTDICAFLIGATTVLPALRSFCVYAGVAIIAVFMLTISLFVAVLTLDAKRGKARRDACCCCIKVPSSWSAMACSQKTNLSSFLRNIYAKAILSVPGKVISLILVSVAIAVGAYGLSLLRQDFDQNWFLPTESPTVEYNKARDKYFSSTEGVRTSVYVGDIDYFANAQKMEDLFAATKQNKFVQDSTVTSWSHSYLLWVTSKYPSQLKDGFPPNKTAYYNWLQVFLSSDGKAFKRNLAFNNKTNFITGSAMQMKHTELLGASEQIGGMLSLQETVSAIMMDGSAPFAYTRKYNGWETNRIISTELIRNLALAGAVVFLITLFLIANILTSFLVLLCVGMTLVEVAGFMYFWGLTVDTITAILMIVAIGLAVDYSAHIGHAFMVARGGNRKARMTNALASIGPAVVHGGFSTFLAFVLLAASSSYVFKTFFKVFFLVVVFGLFNGLLFLPVALSLIGPSSYGGGGTGSEMDEVVVNNGALKMEESKPAQGAVDDKAVHS